MKTITKYLPVGWEEQARKTGAIQRQSGVIRSAESLLRLNMLYVTNGGSLQTAALGMALTEGVRLSKTAVIKRIRGSGEWLRVMSEGLCKTQGAMLEKPAFLGDKCVKLADATDECIKGGKKSAWRLHYEFNLFDFKCENMELTPISEGEKLTRHEVNENDIFIADRIYCTIQGIEHVLAHNGNFILRFKSKAFNLYDEFGKKVELLPILRGLKALEHCDVNVFYRLPSGEMRPIRIVAMKKDADAIAQCKRKMLRKSSKKQEKLARKETLELNEYIVLATSLNYTNAQILELYRQRWQVEMVFFRLKSLFGYGETPMKRDDSAKAWFYGKLFLAALCEKMLKQAHFPPELENGIEEFLGIQFLG